MGVREVLRALNKVRKDMTMDDRGRNYYNEDGERIDYSRPGAGYHKDLEAMYWEDISALARANTTPQLEAKLERTRAELSSDMSPYGYREWEERMTKLQEARKLQHKWGM